MKQAALNGTKLVTADPRRIELADFGVLHCRPPPGHERGVPERARARADPRRARRRATSSPSAPRASRSSPRSSPTTPRPRSSGSRASRPPTSSAPRTSTARRSARRSRGASASPSTCHGSDCVRLIANLALLTGKIGRPGCALLPMRGQNNVQGSSDVGALPDTFTLVPLGRRRGDRAHVRGALGRHDEARARAQAARDARRGARRPRARRCGSAATTSRSPTPTPPASRRRSRASTSSSSRSSSRTRRRKFADVDPAGRVVPREDRHVHERRAAAAARPGRPPTRRARRRPTSRSSSSSRARLGHELPVRRAPRT